MKKILITFCLFIVSCNNLSNDINDSQYTQTTNNNNDEKQRTIELERQRALKIQQQKNQLTWINEYEIDKMFNNLKPLSDTDKIVLYTPNGTVGIAGGTPVYFDPKEKYSQSQLDNLIGLNYQYIEWAYEQLRQDKYDYGNQQDVLNFVRFYFANIDTNTDTNDNHQILHHRLQEINVRRFNNIVHYYDFLGFSIFYNRPLNVGDTLSLTLPSGTVLNYDISKDYRSQNLDAITDSGQTKSLFQWAMQVGNIVDLAKTDPQMNGGYPYYAPADKDYNNQNSLNALRIMQFALANDKNYT